MEHERIIKVYECLSRHTDEGVTVKDIQEYLAQNGNLKNASPLTIRRDIERLTLAGNDIETAYEAHNTARYKLKSKGFTFNEIRFIVDSISINKFLSDGQKQHMIKKFECMCSDKQVRQLISRITLNGQGKPSIDLLENLEKVHLIISEKRKINFEYGKYDVHKHINFYSKHRDMIPCRVVYFDERFYLKCVDERTLSHRTYRIDRMRKITADGKTKINADIPKPDGVQVDIFEPECFEIVTFRVKRFLLDDMIEIFGEYAVCRDDTENPDCVIVRVKIGISQSFCRWVMKYGENIEIISPANIRERFCKELEKISDIYGK